MFFSAYACPAILFGQNRERCQKGVFHWPYQNKRSTFGGVKNGSWQLQADRLQTRLMGTTWHATNVSRLLLPVLNKRTIFSFSKLHYNNIHISLLTIAIKELKVESMYNTHRRLNLLTQHRGFQWQADTASCKLNFEQSDCVETYCPTVVTSDIPGGFIAKANNAG